jgi:hypothetical protein
LYLSEFIEKGTHIYNTKLIILQNIFYGVFYDNWFSFITFNALFYKINSVKLRKIYLEIDLFKDIQCIFCSSNASKLKGNILILVPLSLLSQKEPRLWCATCSLVTLFFLFQKEIILCFSRVNWEFLEYHSQFSLSHDQITCGRKSSANRFLIK